MTAAERGAVIADRYVISEVLRPWIPQHPQVGLVDLGLDAILDVPVIVYTAQQESATELVSTANRAALLADPRIPSITDVGTQDDLVYVVCERTGGTPLSKMLAEGPISVTAARAVIGEVATALTHAAKRGLHHLLLGPESVAVTPEGEVIVRGVGIDAAVADSAMGLGLAKLTSAEAARRDALALINIFYAALTGHWPEDEGRAGLPSAGRKNTRITSAGTFNSELPDELEVFLSGVVGGTDPGPRSPSEIVRYLGSWDRGVLSELPQISRTEDELFAEAAAEPQPSAEPSITPAQPAQPGQASEAQLAKALARIGLIRPGVSGAAAGIRGVSATPYDDQMQMAEATTFPLSPDQLTSTPEWTPAQNKSTQASAHDPNLTAPIMRRDEADPSTQAMPVVSELEDPTSYPDDEGDGSWFLGGMFQTREQEFAQQKAEYDLERRLRQQAAERAQQARDGSDAPAPSAAAPSEPTPPATLREDSPEVFRRRRIFAGLAAVLALILIVGGTVMVLSRGGSEAPAEPAPSTAASSAAPAQDAPAAAAAPLKKATALDPQGDGNENSARAKAVLKAKGVWTSDRYNSPDFGGLKQGIGLKLTLKQTMRLTEVTVNSPAKGGTFEIRVGSDPESAAVLGSGAFGKNTTVTLKPGDPTDSFYVWVTKLPKYKGSPRAAITQIKARGTAG